MNLFGTSCKAGPSSKSLVIQFQLPLSFKPRLWGAADGRSCKGPNNFLRFGF